MILVVLAAYEEEKTIGSLLEALYKTLNKKYPYKIIIVNDGSTDKTKDVVESFRKKIPIHLINFKQNRGLGEAMKEGLSKAAKESRASDIIITMDADNSHRPETILQMMKKIKQGYDVITASRFQKGTMVVGVPKGREKLSLYGSYVYRFLLPIKGIKEYTCAYRAYKASILKKAFSFYGTEFIDQSGFSSTADILLKLRRLNINGAEVPLILRYDLKLSTSKMKLGKNIKETLLLITKRKLEDWFKKYNP